MSLQTKLSSTRIGTSSNNSVEEAGNSNRQEYYLRNGIILSILVIVRNHSVDQPRWIVVEFGSFQTHEQEDSHSHARVVLVLVGPVCIV
jgi:hypothetical protein